MSEPLETPPAAPAAPATPPARAAAPRQGVGCISRFLSALLVIIITTALVLAAVLAVYIYVLDTPGQFDTLRARLATAEVQNASLRADTSALQTQVAAASRDVSTNREAIDELQQQQQAIDALRADLQESVRQNATVVAEARDSRDRVALFATAEAGRAALIDDLKRRSDRIERFLQRLSDISADTALDLSTPTASAAATATPEPPSSTPAPLPTAAPVATPTGSPSATPRSTAVTPAPPVTPTATVTPRATATP